ncbi:hypothetical protein EVAR_74641_1 [Eumeta japonica]|uniref:Histone-lysine N-methyltransferase SETMAR n=1 Tax=Eumeta variegata TaxID=151549 RepID=A0A4C1W9R0_EUMVA|nr:hypothetical protein EVAR_74641_1 [Eumeta japonica]
MRLKAVHNIYTGKKTELTGHPPYSSDLTPNNFYLFPSVKNKLRGQRFSSHEEAVDVFEMHMLEIPQSEWKNGGASRRRRRRPPTASRLKGPRKQKSFAYKLLKRGLAKSFAYKLLKRDLANLMSPTSTSGVAPPLYSRA